MVNAKKLAVILLCLFLLPGCGKQEPAPQTVAIANPWSDWATLQDAETAAGFSFGLPEEIPDACTAAAYRTMNGELLEVIYRSEDTEVRVRKQKGEGQDLSGDYTPYDSCTTEDHPTGSVSRYHLSGSPACKLIISTGGYSWSITAPDGFPGGCEAWLLEQILEP